MPSCVPPAYQGNNTDFRDALGYTYAIRCGFTLTGTLGDRDAHADTFSRCLEYCDLLEGCRGVTYEDAQDNPDAANCIPYLEATGYDSNAPAGLYSAVDLAGRSDGDFSNQDLCTTDDPDNNYNDTLYGPDVFGNCYQIGCGQSTAGSVPNGDPSDLYPTDMTTLLGCLQYCSFYDTCVAVDFTGPHNFGDTDQSNCYPKVQADVSIVGNVPSQTQYASLAPCPT